MIRREPFARQAAITLSCALNVDPLVLAVRAPDARLGGGMKDGLAAFDGAVHDLRVGDIALHLFDPQLLQMGVDAAGSGSEPQARAPRAA